MTVGLRRTPTKLKQTRLNGCVHGHVRLSSLHMLCVFEGVYKDVKWACDYQGLKNVCWLRSNIVMGIMIRILLLLMFQYSTSILYSAKRLQRIVLQHVCSVQTRKHRPVIVRTGQLATEQPLTPGSQNEDSVAMTQSSSTLWWRWPCVMLSCYDLR